MIEVKNLVKKYGSHLAVDHLNFTVDTGQIYGFLGPNGAGKSTTMNIMTGYLGATEGEVLINGHNILEEPEAAKKCIADCADDFPYRLFISLCQNFHCLLIRQKLFQILRCITCHQFSFGNDHNIIADFLDLCQNVRA